MYNNGEIIIIDFGSSKLKSIVERETTMPLITSIYSAKEVVEGGLTLEASDVYSLGVVFYEILLNSKAASSQEMIMNLNNSNLIDEIKDLLIGMVAYESSDRIQSVLDVIEVLIQVIGRLNTNTFKFSFYVSSNILFKLKKSYEIEDSMTLSQFTNLFLPKEFNNLYGLYNQNNDMYKFIGDHFYMEAMLEDQGFNITNIYSIPIDRRQKFRKRFFEISGKFQFYSLYTRESKINDNSNVRPKIDEIQAKSREIEKRTHIVNPEDVIPLEDDTNGF
jgi:serine/threonine protein kinase